MCREIDGNLCFLLLYVFFFSPPSVEPVSAVAQELRFGTTPCQLLAPSQPTRVKRWNRVLHHGKEFWCLKVKWFGSCWSKAPEALLQNVQNQSNSMHQRSNWCGRLPRQWRNLSKYLKTLVSTCQICNLPEALILISPQGTHLVSKTWANTCHL